MRYLYSCVLLACLYCLVVSTALVGQSTPQADSSALPFVSAAKAALVGNNNLSDIELTATVTSMSNPTATGTARIKVKGSSAARVETVFGSARRVEVRNDAQQPAGAWIGPDGVPHRMSLHNCFVPVTALVPQVPVAQMLGADATVSYVGREDHGGTTVDHVRSIRNVPEKNRTAATLLRHLTVVDLYLDSTSHLPAAIRFSLHPDDDAGVDIPVEVRFSNYQSVSGVSVPFRLQQFEQGALVLDLTVTAAAVNTGLPDSDFALQ